MTAIEFLAGWAIRSSALIASGALLLWLLRVKDASIRLTAWTALLVASLVIPALTFTFPKVPIAMMKSQTTTIEPLPNLALNVVPEPVGPAPAVTGRFDWPRAVLAAYSLVALLLLLRLCTGLMMSLRLLRASSATGQVTEGIPVLESAGVSGPVTLGIVRPRIVLPQGWREWNPAKLNAVLAHERSHIRRYDPAVQLLSAIHRAVLWHSPLSWFLHRLIVRTAEEASDDAAVAEVNDRTFYAEVLLEFMQRGEGRDISECHPRILRGFRYRVKGFVLSGTTEKIRGFRCATSGFQVPCFVLSGAKIRGFRYRASKIVPRDQRVPSDPQA